MIFRPFVLPFSIALLVLLAACGQSEFDITPETEQACSVNDEQQFLQDSRTLQSAYRNSIFSVGSLEISRCGFMVVTTSRGLERRAELKDLFAKVGSPSWEIGIAAREVTYRGSGTFQNATMFDYSSANGSKVTRSELVRMNALLNRLAINTSDQGTRSVNIDRELAGAESLQRATQGIRDTAAVAAGVLMSAAANAPAVSSSSDPSFAAPSISSTAPESSESQSSSGYRIFERITFSAGQSVVARGRCNNGTSFNVRFSPGNGNGARDHSINSLFGSSVDDVAKQFCG